MEIDSVVLFWMTCGLASIMIYIGAIVIYKRKWKKVFFITWPIIFILGPFGLLGVLFELYSNRPIPSDR